MAAKGASNETLPYTVNGLMERVFNSIGWFEDATGINISFSLVVNVILVSSILTALSSYLLYHLTRLGLDNFLFSPKLFRILINLVWKRSVFGTPRDVVNYVRAHAEQDNPDLALATADRFAEQQVLIHVGGTKGKILDSVVADTNPQIVLELGAYFGYSAVRMARLMKKKDARLISIEYNASYADASRDFVKFSGLQDRVEIVTGSAADKIPLLRDQFDIQRVDLVLIDHWKDLYVSDLKLLEKTGLMKKGTVVVADNILFPGAPEYAEYVRSSPKYKSRIYPSRMPEVRWDVVDAMEVSVFQGK